MTAVDVAFRYGAQPGEREMRGLDSVREVYGIRKVSFQEGERIVRVEFDATRLNPETVAALLRGAGFDIREKISLV